MAAGCKGPYPPGCWTHEEARTRILTVIKTGIPGTWQPFTHANCVCNQMVAIANRVIGVVPIPTTNGLSDLRSEVKRMYAGLPTHLVPWTMTQVVDSFKDSRRGVYERARLSLLDRPFCKADTRINAFVKAELADAAAKVCPDPRIISARSVRYNLLLAQYLRPLERKIINMRSKRGLRIFAKGQNSVERAEEIRRKFECFDNPVCFSIDASRWDKHMDLKVLEIEHSIYKRAFPGDPFLQQLLDNQLINRCATRDGVRYVCRGRRMSGDMNTGLGNCIVMSAMVTKIMRKLGVPFEIYDDGDDCLLIFSREHQELVRENLARMFLEFGQEVKLENEAFEPTDVVFCQSKMVKTMTGWRMVRNWRKVLSHGTSGTKHWNNLKLIRGMMNAVGSCELALNRGVPIIQSYALALRRIGDGERLKRIDVNSGLMMRCRHELGVESHEFDTHVYKTTALPVTSEARLTFENAFGVPIWEQLAIERKLAIWSPDLSSYLTGTNCVDAQWRCVREVDNFENEMY